MKIEIEIPDEEIAEIIKEKIASMIVGDRYSYDKNLYKRTIQDATRKVIYKDKENIVDRTVAQASAEVKRKAIAKIIKEME